jgi:hypothetical protein
MTYDSIRQCAFLPAPGAAPLTAEFHALAFPAEWRALLLDLYQHGRNPDKIRSVPIRRFRQLLHAVAPELIALARDTSPGDANPVLYSAAPFPAGVTRALVAAWAADLPRGEGAAGLARDTVRRLNAGSLEWTPTPVNMLEQTLSPGGTAVPAESLYFLLPEFLARRIAAHRQYEFEGVRLRFVQAPPTERGAAELVSWPPRFFEPPKGKRGWYFSLWVRVSLQTVPFDARPRVYVHVGVRRWESDRTVFIPKGDRVSVYLAADAPWVDGAPIPGILRFGKSGLVWHPGEKIGWAVGGPEGMLERLTFATRFPDPQALRDNPGLWMGNPAGVTAAVVYSTAMEKPHGVGAGLMPRDRAPLFEWVAEALAPEFVPAPDMARSALPAAPLNAPRRARAQAESGPDSGAASKRRAELASVLGERNLIVDVLWQTSEVRDAIVKAAAEDLGLHGAEVPGETDAKAWESDELDVQIRLHKLGTRGSRLLLDGKVPASRDQRDAAIAERRVAVSKDMTALPPGGRLALAEINTAEKLGGPLADSKIAMRLGFADANLVSQFLHPQDEADGPLEHRAPSAWQDGLRQLGLASLPAHSLSGSIPPELQYLAVWIVRKNRSGPTGHAHFLPVAVLMRPEMPGALGITPRHTQWIPYAELLCEIGQRGTSMETWTREAAQAATERFVRQLLYMLRGRPTLLLTAAQNARSWWPSVRNSSLVRDQIGFGGTMNTAALYGPGLRYVRLREPDAFETAQWFAPNERTGKPGLSTGGLWLPGDATENNRVFGSTTAKPATAQHSAVSASKLVPRASSAKPVIDTGQQAWNPRLLELTIVACEQNDDPEAWAMLTHQLRITPDHQEALSLPLPLHMASLAAEYVLHVEGAELDGTLA